MKQNNISEDAQNIILTSWRPGTAKQYCVYLKQWQLFTMDNNIDSFHPSVNNVLDFLTYLFNKKLSYSAINTARSALSSTVVLSDSSQPNVGNNALISRFLKGVFNARPPMPRYSTTWDVNVVLRYIRSLAPSDDLPLNVLASKLASLCLIVSGQRGQTIHALDLNHMEKSPDTFTFRISVLLKQSKPGKLAQTVEFKAYLNDSKLCVYRCLEIYFRKTQLLRGESTKLFVSCIKPYTPVSRSTFSRWVKSFLADAGIDTSTFKAHSTRAASSSAALAASTPLDCIMRTAGWQSAKTFATFYLRPIENDDHYGHNVLSRIASTSDDNTVSVLK